MWVAKGIVFFQMWAVCTFVKSNNQVVLLKVPLLLMQLVWKDVAILLVSKEVPCAPVQNNSNQQRQTQGFISPVFSSVNAMSM